MTEEKGYQEPLQLDMDFDEALERFIGVNTRDLLEPLLEGEASPFVKWAGGKRSIIDKLEENLPNEFGDYYEGFVGGGALFFHLFNLGCIEQAFLSDVNIDLMLAYKVIQQDLETLIEKLKQHKEKHDKEYYYRVRDKQHLQDPIEVAARFIYLNKTCYNGLYRVNKKGEFNVPIGTYKNPGIVQEDNLRLVNRALQFADLKYQSFEKIQPKENDFVYFDPPYHPVNGSSFTSYTKLDFSEDDQTKLRDFALELHKAGVLVMLSNSNTDFIQKLYKNPPFTVRIVHAPRNVNSKASGRDSVEEVLITTYG